MSELYNKIAALCAENGITVTELCRQCKISRASLSDLKVGRKKNLSTKNLSKIADYLNVPIEFLLNMEQKETPVLTRRDERDIAKRLDMILGDLGDAEASLMFDGEPIDDETRELLRITSLKFPNGLPSKSLLQKSTGNEIEVLHIVNKA